jgi:hypothetical protein
MWESGAFCRIPKRGGKLALGVFHGASFPPRRGNVSISVRTERSDADGAPRPLRWSLPNRPERRSAGFDPGRQFPRRLPAAGLIFLVKAHFLVEARKKSHLEGRCGCIFPSFSIVRVMACFGAGVDASAFAVDSPIGQDPFPSFPLSSLRADLPCSSIWWALWTSRSRMLSARVGSPICSCQRLTGIWLVRIVERSW